MKQNLVLLFYLCGQAPLIFNMEEQEENTGQKYPLASSISQTKKPLPPTPTSEENKDKEIDLKKLEKQVHEAKTKEERYNIASTLFLAGITQFLENAERRHDTHTSMKNAYDKLNKEQRKKIKEEFSLDDLSDSEEEKSADEKVLKATHKKIKNADTFKTKQNEEEQLKKDITTIETNIIATQNNLSALKTEHEEKLARARKLQQEMEKIDTMNRYLTQQQKLLIEQVENKIAQAQQQKEKTEQRMQSLNEQLEQEHDKSTRLHLRSELDKCNKQSTDFDNEITKLSTQKHIMQTRKGRNWHTWTDLLRWKKD